MILTVHVHCTGSISNHCVIFTMCIVQNSAIGIGARNRKITAPHCSRHFCTRSISRYFFGLVIDRARGTLKSGICLCILCILRVRNNGHCQLGACVKNHRPYRRRHRPRRGQYKLNWPLSLVLTLPLTLTLGYTRRPLAASKSELFRKCYSQTANQG